MRFVDSLVGLCVSMFVLAGMVVLFSTMSRQLGRQQNKSDDLQDRNSALTQLVSDIRSSGANPSGALGIPIGKAIPFGIANSTSIELRSDMNADGDIADPHEVVTYALENNKIVRSSNAKKVVLLTDVVDFQLQYVDADGLAVSIPGEYAKLRRIDLQLTTSTGAASHSKILMRNFR